LSETIAAKANVLFYDKDKPGMGRGAAGQLIVTGRRLVYVRFPWKHMHAAVRDYANEIDVGLANEGSLEVPIKELVETKAERTVGTPYLRISYRTEMGERVCSFIFTTSLWMIAGGVYLLKGPIEKLAGEIERLKREAN